MQRHPDAPKVEDIRGFLRTVCAAAAFFSAFGVAMGTMMVAQYLDEAVPAGTITAIVGQTKSSVRLRLEGGYEVAFPNVALDLRSPPVQLAVGDSVEKRQGSLTCLVNGIAVTDARRFLSHWLLSWLVVVPLTAWVIGGTAYVLAFGRTPLWGELWSGPEGKRPPWPRNRLLQLVVLVLEWIASCLLAFMAMGCLGGCLGGVGHAILH